VEVTVTPPRFVNDHCELPEMGFSAEDMLRRVLSKNNQESSEGVMKVLPILHVLSSLLL